MNQIVFTEERKLKCRIPIVVLSVISLICTVLGCATYFISHGYFRIDGSYESELITKFPSADGIFSMVCSLIVAILLVLYILKLYKSSKSAFIVPLCLLTMAIRKITAFIKNISYYKDNTVFDRESVNMLLIRNNVFTVIILGTAILSIIGLFKAFSNRPFIIAAAITEIIDKSLQLFGIFSMYISGVINSNFSDTILLLDIISYIGSITLFVALLLFILKSPIPALTAKANQKEIVNAEGINTEQELRTLNNRRNAGLITEEEYMAQRAEIISRL